MDRGEERGKGDCGVSCKKCHKTQRKVRWQERETCEWLLCLI